MGSWTARTRLRFVPDTARRHFNWLAAPVKQSPTDGGGLYGNRSDMAVADRQLPDGPALAHQRIRAVHNQASRLSRCICHVKTIERDRKPLPQGFDISFFSSPAVKETPASLLQRQRKQNSIFTVGKKVRCNASEIDIQPHEFDVDTDRDASGHRNQRDRTGMREVEEKISVAIESRFAKVVIPEAQRRGWRSKVVS